MAKTEKPGIVFFGIKYFPSRGGTSRVAENLIRLLHHEYKVRIYCYRNMEARNHIEDVKTYQIPEIPLGSPGVFIYYFLCTVHLLLFVNRRNLIHAHKTDCAFFLPLLRLKFKVIATSHEAPYTRDKWNFFGRIYFHAMEWFFMHSGALLTSISLPLKNYYEKRYRKLVMYIPNGIQSHIIVSEDEATEILKEHGIEGEFILFAARRIMSTKGCHTMLQALLDMKYAHPIVIAGDESHAPEYMRRIKKDYKDLNIRFIGFISSLPCLMGLIRKSRLFIFPSETEGMSMMLLEVASSGAAIIASDIPENTEVFTPEEMLYFKNKDAQDLKEKIIYALAHPEILKERSEKAQRKILKKYQWSAIIEAYKTIYRSVGRQTQKLR